MSPKAGTAIPEFADEPLLLYCSAWFEQQRNISETAVATAGNDTFSPVLLTEIGVARNLLRTIAACPASSAEGYRAKFLVAHALIADIDEVDISFVRACLNEYICHEAP